MLNPTPIELLGQVADALAATVLPELQPGPARDELHAGIAVIRRVARCLPAYRQFLHDDISDMAATLRAVASGPRTTAGSDVDGLLAQAGALAPTVTPLDDLVAMDLELRAVVAALAARHAAPGAEDVAPPLVPLLARMTEREASLRLSPWER